MRFLWTFLFLGCVLSTSHAQLDSSTLETSAYEEEHSGDLSIIDFTKDSTLPLESSSFPALASVPALEINPLNPVPFVRVPMASLSMIGKASLSAMSDLGSTESGVSLDGKDDLLEAAVSLIQEGLLCKGPLGGLCGHGSLVGMNEVLKIIYSGKLKKWFNIIYFNVTQVSGKSSPSLTYQLQFQTTMTLSFLGLFRLLGGATVNVNIKAPVGLGKTEFRQVLLTLQNCQPIVTGIHVHGNVLAAMMEPVLKLSLKISLPNMLCPVVRFWLYLVNQQLTFLQNVMLRDLTPLLSLKPQMAEQQDYLDFQDKHFPDSFTNWLIERAESQLPTHAYE